MIDTGGFVVYSDGEWMSGSKKLGFEEEGKHMAMSMKQTLERGAVGGGYDTDEELDGLEHQISERGREKRESRGNESDSDFMADEFKEIREEGIRMLMKRNAERRRMEGCKKMRKNRKGSGDGKAGSGSGARGVKVGREGVRYRKGGEGRVGEKVGTVGTMGRRCRKETAREAIKGMSSREAVESLNRMFNVAPVKVGKEIKCAPGIPYRYYKEKKKEERDGKDEGC